MNIIFLVILWTLLAIVIITFSVAFYFIFNIMRDLIKKTKPEDKGNKF